MSAVKHGSGNIRKRHGSWQLRYYTTVVGPDGQTQKKQVTKVLARVSDKYRNPSDCRALADEYLVPERKRTITPEGSLTVTEFAERYFLPYISRKREPSTHKFYRDLFNNHLRSRVGYIELKEFSTRKRPGCFGRD